MSDAMFFLSLMAVWIGINVLFLALRVVIVPRWELDQPPASPAHTSVGGENARPDRRERGSFTAPVIPFDPSNRTALTRSHLTALTKAGDRSGRHAS